MRNEEIIHSLGSCINHCNYCADACLDEDNLDHMVRCIRLNRICAEACAAASQILAIHHAEVKNLIEYCIKTCDQCAVECSKNDHDQCHACATCVQNGAYVCRIILCIADDC